MREVARRPPKESSMQAFVVAWRQAPVKTCPVVWYGMQCNAWKGQISSLMSAQLYRGMRDDMQMQPSRIEAAARHVLVAKMDDQMNKET